MGADQNSGSIEAIQALPKYNNIDEIDSGFYDTYLHKENEEEILVV
jgi:hypothetical protein